MGCVSSSGIVPLLRPFLKFTFDSLNGSTRSMADDAQSLPGATAPATPVPDADSDDDSHATVSFRNQGAVRRRWAWALCSCLSVRTCVSRKKRRFIGDGVDLDLSYITDRLIAMGYPSVGLEACYRNPAPVVRSFLARRHGGRVRVWNLCSEREYTGIFGPDTEVERFAWPDHTAPPAALLLPACESMDAWLRSHPANVAVVHCKAGKGRTGVLVSAYLMHSRVEEEPAAAVARFAARRTHNLKGITIPSQMRAVEQYHTQLQALRLWGRTVVASRRTLHSIRQLDLPASATSTAARATPASALLLRVEGRVHTLRLTRCSDRSCGFQVDVRDKACIVTGIDEGEVEGGDDPLARVALRDVMSVGDELLSVGGVYLNSNARSMSKGEVASLLRSAVDPVLLQLRRAAPHASVASTPLASTAAAVQVDLTTAARVLEGGVGPWCEGSDPTLLPSPSLLLTGLELHPPLAPRRRTLSCTEPEPMVTWVQVGGAATQLQSSPVRVWGDFTLTVKQGRVTRARMDLNTAFLPLPEGVVTPSSRATLGCLFTLPGADAAPLAPAALYLNLTLTKSQVDKACKDDSLPPGWTATLHFTCDAAPPLALQLMQSSTQPAPETVQVAEEGAVQVAVGAGAEAAVEVAGDRTPLVSGDAASSAATAAPLALTDGAT